jgi:hypothetical protein
VASTASLKTAFAIVRYWPNSAGSQQKELSEQRANPDLPAFPPAAKFAIT